MLIWGTPAALLYGILTASIFYLDPHRSTTAQVIYDLAFFECVTVAAAMMAASLPSKSWSTSGFRFAAIGITCVVVASFALLILSSLYNCLPMYRYYRSHPAAFFDKVYFDLKFGAFLVVVTHVGSFFVPEILGGICGYKIFEDLKSRPQ